MKLLLAIAVFVSSAAFAAPLTPKEREARRQAERGQSVPTPHYNYNPNVKYPGPLSPRQRELRRQEERGQSVPKPNYSGRKIAKPKHGKFSAKDYPYSSPGCWYGNSYQRMICRGQTGNHGGGN